MDEHKKLNKSKFFNKNKHKNPKYAQKKRANETVPSKPVELLKNWDRYDEEEHPEEEARVESSKDYSVIANRPISQGTSFHFKKDKYFLPDERQRQPVDDIFKIDLNLLSLGLETIPFFERLNIDEKYFKEDELQSMKSEAEEALIVYESAVKNKLNDSNAMDNNFMKKLSIKEENKIASDESLSTSTDSLNVEVNAPVHNRDAVVQDLEDWLDDILK